MSDPHIINPADYAMNVFRDAIKEEIHKSSLDSGNAFILYYIGEIMLVIDKKDMRIKYSIMETIKSLSEGDIKRLESESHYVICKYCKESRLYFYDKMIYCKYCDKIIEESDIEHEKAGTLE